MVRFDALGRVQGRELAVREFDCVIQTQKLELLFDKLMVLAENVSKLDAETVQPDALSVPEDLDGNVVVAPQSPFPSKARSNPAGVLYEFPDMD